MSYAVAFYVAGLLVADPEVQRHAAVRELGGAVGAHEGSEGSRKRRVNRERDAGWDGVRRPVSDAQGARAVALAIYVRGRAVERHAV